MGEILVMDPSLLVAVPCQAITLSVFVGRHKGQEESQKTVGAHGGIR